jgi:hypothetical protein
VQLFFKRYAKERNSPLSFDTVTDARLVLKPNRKRTLVHVAYARTVPCSFVPALLLLRTHARTHARTHIDEREDSEESDVTQ